jgi:hypothetical protein
MVKGRRQNEERENQRCEGVGGFSGVCVGARSEEIKGKGERAGLQM